MNLKFPLQRLGAPQGTWGISAPFPPRRPAYSAHQVGRVSQPFTAVAAQGEEPDHSKGKPAGQNPQILPCPAPEEAQENRGADRVPRERATAGAGLLTF